MPSNISKNFELPKLSRLPKLPGLRNTPKSEVNQKEGRLTLLTSKLLESSEVQAGRAASKWQLYAMFFLACANFKYYFAALSLPIFCTFAGIEWSSVSSFGISTALHPTFIFGILICAGLTVLIAFGLSFYMAFILVLTSAGSQVGQTPFPSSLYLQKTGFAFWDRNKVIPWQNVRAVKVRELLFSGKLRTDVLELYVEEPKIKLVQKLLNVFGIDGLKRRFYFFDPVTQKPVRDQYEGVCLRLPLVMFGFENEKQKFLSAIKDHVDPEAFDGDLEIDCTASDAESFTQLWLSDLRSSNQSDIQRRLEVGHSLCGGRYVVEGILGYGGFSVVYSARVESNCDDESQPDSIVRQVAIKEIVLNSGGTRTSKENILKHIVSEVELLKSLQHENIVQCLDFFTEGGKIYVVLEAFPGKNLRDYVEAAGPLNEHQLVEVALQCCSILDYLHSRPKPVIHRDFTPDNLIRVNGSIKLIDFNVAEEANANSSQTIVGKHAYLAPEQWCGQFTASGDLYQLGCTLYFLATGADPEPLTQSVLNDSIVSPRLSEVVRKLTSPNIELRYASAKELSETLRSIYTGEAPDAGRLASEGQMNAE